ncbi:MetQ/NlpA family ABC transporter substrate-binding protein [Kurthia huakuii]|uniref:MetQ/NlpA family ABC transporter substrate-binding protein n=1 Tax=Kurthia huakuii TaxID=1421019 RepID=UPI0004975FB6|nr:MetQ/NlpA family ABC transporter substrate-binding protein [Kurthia huakuii]MBM7698943.1 D-methionine transport system substrate-binding protein [Kurthia huakuii]
MKKWLAAVLLVIVTAALAACGGDSKDTDKETTSKDIIIGATAGPYSDMLEKAIVPGLEDKGYKVTIKEFSDYIQPNNALDNGDIDANLFQHSVYLENFNKENGTKLKPLIIVPTAPMGFFSEKYKSVEELPDGAKISIANDPSNLARTLKSLQDQRLIEISDDVDPLVASTKDITKNPKNFEFKEIEAAGLPRAIETSDLAGVPGNFALAANLNLEDAVFLEDMPDKFRNVVAVREADENAQLAKDIKAVVESADFEKIIDKDFKGFGKPEWMEKK